MAAPIIGYAQAGDGCKLFYRLHPRARKPRLVLIHSLALDSSIWDGIVHELAAEAEILAYDCRGHGQSEKRAGKYTGELFAEDLATLLDHIGWPSAAIAGCSMGGVVAMAFGGAFSTRTEALALLDTTAWYGPSAEKDWRGRAEKAVKDGFASMIPFQLSRWFSESFLEGNRDIADALSRVFQANDLACYQSACEMLGTYDFRGLVRSLRMPVAVIVGEEDYATPVAMSQALHDAISGSALHIIKSGRHLTPVQCPKEISAYLRDLMRKRAAAGTASS